MREELTLTNGCPELMRRGLPLTSDRVELAGGGVRLVSGGRELVSGGASS